MSLLPLDWALTVFAGLMLLMGLFGGLSGFFALAAAFAVSVAAAMFGWPRLGALGWSFALKILVSAVGVVVVFGIVRMIVKKIVGSLLAQPADAIFGCIVAVVCTALLVTAIASNPGLREKSNFAGFASGRVGADVRSQSD